MTYQNRSFSWTINKMGSEVEKIVAVPSWLDHQWYIEAVGQIWVFFRVVSCNGPQRFTSGSLYTNYLYICESVYIYLCLTQKSMVSQPDQTKNDTDLYFFFTICRAHLGSRFQQPLPPFSWLFNYGHFSEFTFFLTLQLTFFSDITFDNFLLTLHLTFLFWHYIRHFFH